MRSSRRSRSSATWRRSSACRWRRWRSRGALKNPNVSTVITGASKASQVESNMKALDVVPKLTNDVMARIESILTAGA
jgi:predicted aldo/keto reductase-like oxidoreductase